MTRAPSLTRRQVLRGAGGFTLALPWLPSLLPRGAEAGGSPFAEKRFIAMCTEHGGIWEQNMHPAAATLTETIQYAGHTIRRGDLTVAVDGTVASLSPVLRGPATLLTPALAAKMNVVRGLDIAFYIAHQWGAHLGNYTANSGGVGDGMVETPTRTIDQIMAWSPSFYPDLGTILERSLVIGHDVSWGWSNPMDPTSDVQPLPVEWSSLALFNRIFVPEEDELTTRPPVVDRVMANYQSLRQSDRRLSTHDRQRLDDHMARIEELQRRLEVAVSCGDIMVPTDDSWSRWNDPTFPFNPQLHHEFWRLFNDVIIAAFVCGTSRIATLRVTDTFSSSQADWHQQIAHLANQPDGSAQQVIADAHQHTFESVFLDLVAKLDAIEEGDGTTMLDHTFAQWSQESGQNTHEFVDVPIVTAGSAGGAMRTGQYIDYRNQNQVMYPDPNIVPVLKPGLTYNQWLGTVLQVMGVPPSEYELDPQGGYPYLYVGQDRGDMYPQAVRDAAGEALPWIMM